MQHGVYLSEVETAVRVPVEVESGVVAAIGVAPKPSEPVICYSYKEAVEKLGYSEDFSTYSLCEVMKSQFQLYGVAPVVLINVLDYSKHYNEIDIEYKGQSSFKIEGIYEGLYITSGEEIPGEELKAGEDYEVREEEVEDVDEGTSITKTLRLKASGEVAGSITISYRTSETALGGTEIETEVRLTPAEVFELPATAILETVRVRSGGVHTLVNVEYEEESGDGYHIISVIDKNVIVGDTIRVRYHEIDAGKVSKNDIVEAMSKLGEVYPKFNILPGTIIAPKYSMSGEVAAAMGAAAQNISGVFKAMAIVDVEAAEYQGAVTAKNAVGYSNTNVIVCWPKVTLGGEEYHLSTHIAGLMNQVDSANGGLPYVSPSNKSLQVDGAVAGSSEVFLNREQANFLNGAGIVTAFAFNGWRCWGNMTGAYPASGDVKDVYISTRRMLNYLETYLIQNYLSELDVPITRRQIDSILQSSNIYLGSLTARGALLGAEMTFDSEENAVTDLLAGRVVFHLRYASPTPAQEINFKIEFDASYFESLFE